MKFINKETIKINEVIHKYEAFEAVGYKLLDKLKEMIECDRKPILLILDFSELYLLTYGFVEIALRDIVEYTKQHNDLILLYKINKPELDELITGIIDMLELQKYNRESLNERSLLEQHYSISYFEENKKIEYIGKINSVEKDILEIIELKGEIIYNEIDNQLKAKGKDDYCEDIAESVKKLFELGFIFQTEKMDGIPTKYFSLKKLMDHEN